MIVNPQVFNYRFTIGTLVVAITALIVYSYSSYTSAQSKEDFFKQEKKLLESQTSKIITSYDELDNIKTRLELELDSTKQRITQTQDSLEELQANMSLIYKYKQELTTLKKHQSSLLKKEDSFSNVNNELSKQNASIAKLLNEQLNVISSLKEEKAKLDNNLKKGALVTANSFKATTFGFKNSGKLLETNKANKTKNFKIDFVLAENPLALIQEKEFYYQIIGPDNNVVSDKGAIEFDRSSLIYSHKTSVLYSKKTLDVSVNIEVEETLKSGRYLINIFESNKRVGNTKIILQ